MNNMQRRKFADLFEARACAAISEKEYTRIHREKELKAKVEKQLGITRRFAHIKSLEQTIKSIKNEIEAMGIDLCYANECRIDDKNGIFATTLQLLKSREIKPKEDLVARKEEIVAAIWASDNINQLREILIHSRKHFPFSKKTE